VDTKAFKDAPREALAAGVARVDVSGVWRTFLRLLEENDPVKAFELADGLPQLEEALGFNVEEDFLPSMGTQVLAYAVQSGGALIPDFVMLSRLRDPLTFERCLTQIRTVFAEQWSLKEMFFQDTVIYYQPKAKVCPCFAIKDDKLLFSLFLPSLKRAILRQGKAGASFAEREDVRAVTESLAPSRSLLVLGDFRRIFEMAYNTFYPVLRTTPPAELPVRWHAMPPAEVLSQHFGPFQLGLSSTKTGILVQGASPLGGALPVSVGVAALAKEKENAQVAQAPDAADREAAEEPAEGGPNVF
jgi:hypothetical protein